MSNPVDFGKGLSVNSVSWQMNVPFQEHCKMLWDKEAELYSAINNTQQLRDRIKALDDWYEVLKTMRRRIISYIYNDGEKAAKRMKRIMSDIQDELIRKDYDIDNPDSSRYYISITDAPITEKQFVFIKQHCEEFSELIFRTMGDHGLLIQKKPPRTPGLSWM